MSNATLFSMQMTNPTLFNKIRTMAEQRKGGAKALKSLLLPVRDQQALLMLTDDRYLAMMARAIYQAGFNWTVIHNKWSEIEEAFFAFNLQKLSLLPPESWEAYCKDTRVVRHWKKIQAIQDNLAFVLHEAAERGSFAQLIATWPTSDQIGLMQYLKHKGTRLGGNTAQWFLRYVGKDCFVLSKHVILALRGAGCDIVEKPNSKRDLARIQSLFNEWHQQTGLPYTHLSQIAAFAVGENYDITMIKQELAKFEPI